MERDTGLEPKDQYLHRLGAGICEQCGADGVVYAHPQYVTDGLCRACVLPVLGAQWPHVVDVLHR